MNIKDIDTKKIYAYASQLENEKKKFDEDVEKAWTFHAEGYMSDEQYAALRTDREAKADPWKQKADLLRRFARAAEAQWVKEEKPDAAWLYGYGDKVASVDDFDIDAVNDAIRCAAALDDPFPC
nr:MAG TPA: protein of unknown function (DUF5495) [Caudoviricetes sp.]